MVVFLKGVPGVPGEVDLCTLNGKVTLETLLHFERMGGADMLRTLNCKYYQSLSQYLLHSPLPLHQLVYVPYCAPSRTFTCSA